MNKYILIICSIAILYGCSVLSVKTVNPVPPAFDRSSMNLSVNPCEDFYRYAIGNWQKNNPVPSTENRWGAFNIVFEENKVRLFTILDRVAENTSAEKGSEEQYIRDLYLSAMDTVDTEKERMAVLSGILTKHVASINSIEGLNHSLSQLLPLGISGPFSFYVGRDQKNSSRYIVNASQSGLSLPDRDYYLRKDEKSHDIQENFKAHVDRMLNMAGYQIPNAGTRIYALESKLAEISWPRTELRDPNKTLNFMDCSQWDQQLENTSLVHILGSLGLNDADSINVGQPSYFKALDTLFNIDMLEDWKIYLTWNVISSYAPYLGDHFEKEDFNFFSKILRGTKEMKSRRERVLNVVNSQLGEPMGKLFVKEYFPESSKQYMVQMIENLRAAFRASINDLEWMSSDTKEKAIRKLNAFSYKIGYPDKWKDYSGLEINPENYLTNILNINEFNYKKMVDKLGKPVDKEEWGMTPQTVNAYYSASGNEIVFPAGILQPPFFHPSFDDAINYGGIGAVIGHEFSHGFDDKGSQYDWEGNLNNWWTDEDREAFEKLVAELAAQYSAYNPIDSLHVNGELTSGENIADLGGVTLAYAALQIAYDGKEPAPIDGFTWQQRFFLGWANVWKANITDEALIYQLTADPHSPAQYRGNGPLINFKPFDEAFGPCHSGAMHKPDSLKIKIW